MSTYPAHLLRWERDLNRREHELIQWERDLYHRERRLYEQRPRKQYQRKNHHRPSSTTEPPKEPTLPIETWADHVEESLDIKP